MQGKISDVDIQRIAKELGENFTLQEIQEMVQEADRDGELFYRHLSVLGKFALKRFMHFCSIFPTEGIHYLTVVVMVRRR
jgi:hypothetical protein